MPPVAAPLTRIRDLMDAEGRKLVWLAGKLGISKGHMTNILNGERTLTAAQAQAIADALGVPVALILSEKGGDNDGR